MKKNFYIGQRWYVYYGNGMKLDTVIRVVDNLRVELAGAGVVQKSWLNKYWMELSELF